MRSSTFFSVAGCLCYFFSHAAIAQERATISGTVSDTTGKPVDGATVLVYKAGVKKGYSTFCPSCYMDCGKRATTEAKGKFALSGLNPDLLFTLLVVRDGYASTVVSAVDPAKGPVEDVVLKTRARVRDVSRIVRGRVVNAQGDPVKDAVIEQQGVTYKREDGNTVTQFGPTNWTDVVAVTNQNGEFEIAYGKPAERMILQVSPRGMAAKIFTESTGAEPKTLTVSDGATIRGRLVKDGKGVSNAEMGLATYTRRASALYSEMRIGTREDGTFAITNVPAGRVWNLYAKMESLASRGAAEAVICQTKDDGQVVDVGDIQVRPAYKLCGKVILSDGKAIPEGMRVILGADRTSDSQTLLLGSDGAFEFSGLAVGVYSLGPAVKGYRLQDGSTGEVLIDGDVSDLRLLLHPTPAAAAGQR